MEYGISKAPHNEKNKCKPKFYYGISKLKSTQILKKQIELCCFKIVPNLRPYQKINRLVPIAINRLINKKSFNASSGNKSEILCI